MLFFFRRCKSGQPISSREWCDGLESCFDRSDEAECPRFKSVKIKPFHRKAGRVIVHFDGTGNFTDEHLNPGEICPDSHFTCNDDNYCLPVYLRYIVSTRS